MNGLIHESMIAAANRKDDSIALKMDGQQLNYQKLEQGSANIALCLADFKLEKEACVGLFMDKQIDAVVSIYGILRAGAAYVPLDISNPSLRIQHIVNECDISVLITTNEHVGSLSEMLKGIKHFINIIVLTDEENQNQPKIDNIHFTTVPSVKVYSDSAGMIQNQPVKPDNLATVLYTSGSTGLPKGAMLTHACVSTFTQWAVEAFQLDSSDRVASHAPLHFDLSLFDIFAVHRAGASVVLIPGAKAGNPKLLAKLIEAQQITIWQSVPSALVLLDKYGNLDKYNFDHLRHVLFAGERMCVQSLRRLAARFRNAAFHNIYGATETNDTFMYSIPANCDAYPDPLPIGSPLPYVDYKIVDEDFNLVHAGHEGELLVNTPTMMRRYRDNNKKVMIYLGDKKKPGSKKKFYRTRDIVRMLPGGHLHLIGRNDDIIKSTGFRINLLEIEGILQNNAKLSEIAVIAQKDAELGNKIIAFATVLSDDSISTLELKMYCAQYLPKYAIPHAFEISSTPLPKTSSGKIDKKRLIHLCKI